MRTFTQNFSVVVIGLGGPNERSRPGESSCDLIMNYHCQLFPLRDKLRVLGIPGL